MYNKMTFIQFILVLYYISFDCYFVLKLCFLSKFSFVYIFFYGALNAAYFSRRGETGTILNFLNVVFTLEYKY